MTVRLRVHDHRFVTADVDGVEVRFTLSKYENDPPKLSVELPADVSWETVVHALKAARRYVESMRPVDAPSGPSQALALARRR